MGCVAHSSTRGRAGNHGRTFPMTTTTYYGFERANHVEEPAWFHTREAAERFNVACGSILGAIGESNNPDPADVLDTPEMPWRLSL